MMPHRGFHPSATLVTINPYIFHIGLALIFFGYAPHIAFIRRLTGLSWPALPDMVMYIAAAAYAIHEPQTIQGARLLVKSGVCKFHGNSASTSSKVFAAGKSRMTRRSQV